MYQSLESPGAWGKAVFAALNFYIIQAAALQSTHSGTLTPESFSVSQYKHRFFHWAPAVEQFSRKCLTQENGDKNFSVKFYHNPFCYPLICCRMLALCSTMKGRHFIAYLPAEQMHSQPASSQKYNSNSNGKRAPAVRHFSKGPKNC